MYIYKCILCNDEMFADTFKVAVSPDGMFYEVEGKMTTRKEGIDGSLISANASAEEASETSEDPTVSGVDIVINHKLQLTSFDKKGYLTYMKDYVKAIKAHLEANNPERVEKFVADSPGAVKRILSDLKNFEFYTGESMNLDGMVGMLNFRDDGITPYMLFFKDGLIAEKC